MSIAVGIFRSAVLKGVALKIDLLWNQDRAGTARLLKEMKKLQAK